MEYRLWAVMLVVLVTPAIAATDSALPARPPPAAAAGVDASDASGAPLHRVVQIAADVPPRRLQFTGAVVVPAGGAHPDQPVIGMHESVRTIGKRMFRVLEVVYQ